MGNQRLTFFIIGVTLPQNQKVKGYLLYYKVSVMGRVAFRMAWLLYKGLGFRVEALGYMVCRVEGLGFGATVLGGSWVVITGVISPLMWVVSIVTSLVTPTWASKY